MGLLSTRLMAYFLSLYVQVVRLLQLMLLESHMESDAVRIYDDSIGHSVL